MSANDLGIRIEENVLKGKEIVVKNPCNHLGKAILEKLEAAEDFVCQIDAVTGEKYTFKKTRERSVRSALWMKKEGLIQGDIIVVCSHNQLDNSVPCFGALYLGAIFSPWDAGLNAKDFSHLMNVCKPKMAFVSDKIATTIAEAAKKSELDIKIIVFGKVDGFLEFENIIAEPSIEDVNNFKVTDIEIPNEIAVISCSSGTTGLPKGVALSHASIYQLISRSIDPKFEGVVGMVYSSLHWFTGTIFMFCSVFVKLTNVLTPPPPFEENSACTYIEKYKVNWILMAPNMINRLLKFTNLDNYNFSYVRLVLIGGSPLSFAAQESFAKFIPNGMIVTFYGITECGGTISCQSIVRKPGSCGHVVENTELKVIDPETGRLLGPNQRGEFHVRNKNMMSYYYNNPEATAETVDEEGFLHTGDIGYYDEDGEIFIVDRLKDLIKYCNYQISPNEIENVILSHPGVKEAVVVGLPHPEDGDHPIAFVVRSSDKSDTEKQVSEADLVDLVATELSDTKQLRGGVKFVDSLPKTPSDKVLRKLIRELAKSTM